jgi:chromosome segregation ATPase
MVVAKRRGRPPKVAINTEAMIANSQLKEAKKRILELEAHVTFLKVTLEEIQESNTKLHAELATDKENNYKLARHNESLVVVIQYLESKVFPQSN